MIGRAFRWIITTPRRALAVGVALGLLVVVVPAIQLLRTANYLNHTVGRVIAQPATRATGPANSSTPTSSPSGTAALTGSDDLTPVVVPAAASVAQQFATRWIAGHAAKSTDQWVATLRPLVTPGLVPFLEVTNRSELPEGLAGTPVADPQGHATAQRFTVPVNTNVRLLIDVDWDGSRWLVSRFGPVQ